VHVTKGDTSISEGNKTNINTGMSDCESKT
jgi:hypothetical protein